MLQELTPGKRNSFSFIDGKVNGRELFVTTRNPAGKRGRSRKKQQQDDGNVKENPKRGRPRKRDIPGTPGETPTPTPKRKSPKKQATPQMEEVEIESIEPVHMLDGTETSQADVEEEGTQTYSEFDDDGGGFNTSEYDIETPTRNEHDIESPTQSLRDETPLPVQPYYSFHSSPPSSPIYEEYQVPIPTSSSPIRRSIHSTPSFPPPPIQTPTPYDKIQRRRSRSASRERRMSIAPIPQWKGLPSTPVRTTSHDSDDQVSTTSTKTTDIRSPLRKPSFQPVQRVPDQSFEVREAVYAESMTPVRNWASEIAEGAFRFDKSPSKFVKLDMEGKVTASSKIHSVTIEDEDDDGFLRDDDGSADDERDGFAEDDLQEFSPSQRKNIPQINRLRESPIVITSSPPEQAPQNYYQWKTVVDPPPPSEPDVSTVESEPSISVLESEPAILDPSLSDSLSEPEMSPSQCRISSYSRHSSRQSSPARSILNELGDDVIDISSLSPGVAKRAANILLRSPYYSKITFNEDGNRRIWQDAMDNAGEYELSQIEDSEGSEDEDMEDEDTEDGEDMEDIKEESPTPVARPRISQGEWTKRDWKRMEKCLDITNGEQNDAIDLFLQRYVGRERDEVEMRCKAVLLTRRRKLLEGRKVGFILSTDE